MRLIWNSLLLSLVVLVAGLGTPTQSFSSSYPTKPIRLVVPYPPGGSADVLARVLGQQLSLSLDQPVVVENKPGAGTAIGAKAVAQSPADGYTLLIGTVSSHAMNPALTKNIGYDPVGDFTAIAPLASIPFVLLAQPKLPVRSLPELIELARQQPGKLNYSSAGNGTSNHLAGEMLNMAAKVRIVHIPYKGSAPALNGLLSGEVELMFDLLTTAAPHVKAGSARALAITTQQRSPLLPDVPAVGELDMRALELSAWFGLFGPRDLPADVREVLGREVGKIVESAGFRERLQGLGASPMNLTPRQFNDFVVNERDRWSQVIKAASIGTD
ncbi:MAG: tripartite tricarboxylate transporter substrate binding protein [Burkholderiaceae bacterium]|nr:tripartite tricarboxylate transporter substrate binding protein [Burkholderiaceae bacterium]